jgi:hypothetical protein
MTIVGAFAFGDFIFEPWNAAGLTVSMLGAVWYAMRSALRVRGTQQGSRQQAAGAALDCRDLPIMPVLGLALDGGVHSLLAA